MSFASFAAESAAFLVSSPLFGLNRVGLQQFVGGKQRYQLLERWLVGRESERRVEVRKGGVSVGIEKCSQGWVQRAEIF